jgi:hypothetical protein
MIKLKCSNDKCAFTYSVSEGEFEEYAKTYHSFCMICGAKLDVVNLEEIVRTDIDTEIRDNVSMWFRTLGIEYTLEMIERHKDLAVYRLYKAEIERRGLKLSPESGQSENNF